MGSWYTVYLRFGRFIFAKEIGGGFFIGRERKGFESYVEIFWPKS